MKKDLLICKMISGDKKIKLTVEEWSNLARKGTMIPLTTCLHGSSMEPLIRYMKDSITIIPVNRQLKVGDIVLYKRADGKYVVHRLYRIIEDEKLVQTWGDNCDKPDPLMPISSILGIGLYLQKNGKQQLLDTDEQRKRGINWINSKYRRKGWMEYKKIRRKIGNVLRKMT